VECYKGHLVACGFTQRHQIDYEETFAPVTKLPTIQVLLALVAAIYMHQPPGFELPGREKEVCELKKMLYSLKQSGRAWYQKLDAHLWSIGFTRTHTDNCVYVQGLGTNDIIILAVYVDDLSI